ncbi:PREDICTED: myotubularin-related protein 4 isoform X1 [Rhagoletis zephyria]|uniref:myotubularin-related protein 4 isoform X1 n=1 Tax=Rhagoletis zephyria TaxID=28612 RepID=UPI0008119AF9|nr:PREDICTED: myotubularin-related protein 4 isoform X1 [Rhagoletis zephyria]XP_017480638.1 PREDICTED: myotubularin-related protein 4 isoform X1 [Rhagoletis zephyria]XP_017480639.1 PREDICTED: myotubularin-related protein 4 isoform X1 [Rhagoletis zephyria]XP_017480640.1 PREDICTED: myotubularin-related protein 4 isoform X1 [Rhagoletis zephyria]XP_017480641.1 PREDICTED: myotubularin-related protein 4 isoform X1 [Rhagoletis zephyria]
MEGSDGSPPPSLCIVRATEFFPKSQMEKEDTQLTVPFQELAGESVKYLGRTDDGVLALSTYRIFMLKNSTNSETSVPLGLIESVHIRDLFQLIINCKDASTVKCSFETAEQCSDWQRRINQSVGVPPTLEALFAFPFHSYMCDAISVQNGDGIGRLADGSIIDNSTEYLERLQRASRDDDDFMREVERLGFDLNGAWRISKANEEFKLCPSYPQKLLVPGCISDEMLNEVANFRGSRRLPAVVWRHRKSGAVIARCSQPEVGWFGWRSTKDEQLFKALADACAFDRGEQMRRFMQCTNPGLTMTSGENSPSSTENSHEEVALDEVRKILIIDARSYASAVTNRARGGGCECIEYYPCAEIEFMNLGNIHVIRKSFHALRQLCASPPDCPNWLGLLEKTMWLQHLSGLLAAAVTVCHAIEKKGRPVLVHCSDGWDRTPQIVATAQLCLDPFYRTVEGFRILVEREWLSFGHKFSDRCGHGPGSEDVNERCPVFLQWLDIVHQIHRQFPCSFEFNMAYLIKLAQHSHSCLFGTFLCNTYRERLEKSVFERTFSVWPFLSGPMYKNPLYIANRDAVIWPAHHVRDLYLWTDVYLGSLGNQNSIDFPNNSNETVQGSITPMTKTRSYGDLTSANIMQSGISRRSSDPNVTLEPNLTMTSNFENNCISNMKTERGDSPDDVNDTIQKIQNLTMQLNNQDEENFTGIGKTADELQKDAQKGLNEDIMDDDQVTENMSLQDKFNNMSSVIFDSYPFEALRSNIANLNETAITHKTTDVYNITHNGVELGSLSQYDEAKNTLAATEIRDTGGGKNLSTYKACMNEDLMLSVDLSDASSKVDDAAACEAEERRSIWHGSINTSTDTLVPIERRQSNDCREIKTPAAKEIDVADGSVSPERLSTTADKMELGLTSPYVLLKQERKNSLTCNTAVSSIGVNGLNNSILPKVHGSSSTSNRSNILSNSSSNASISSTSSSLNNLKNIRNSNNSLATTMTDQNCDNKSENEADIDPDELDADDAADPFPNTHAHSNDSMNESIIILPEHRKLEISVSGNCETISNNGVSLPTTPTDFAASATVGVRSGFGGVAAVGGAATHRRRRTSSSNSNPNRFFDGINIKLANGSTTRFSLPGARSLPMTPPAQQERPQITISCPDGLAHALSEQNLRLQQIVLEHKVREDVLLREIHDMRMALLKKICPNCNVAQTNANDEQEDEILLSRCRIVERTTRCQCLKARSCNKCKLLQQQQMREQQQQRSQSYQSYKRRHRLQRYHTAIGHHGRVLSRYRYCHCICQNSYNQRRRYHSFSCSLCYNNEDDMLTDDDNDITMAMLMRNYSCDCRDSNSSLSANSAIDNIENASICSWEAVEDRSAPSSSASSSIQQPNTASVLWVPDHAVKRCTSCQVEFWIGRRRHHCRSCGQIFCADCSEFWAPLPDAKLFNPVRLCGPCYHAVTTRIQLQSRSSVITNNMPNYTTITTSSSANSTTASTVLTASGATKNLPNTATPAVSNTSHANATTVTTTSTSSTMHMTAPLPLTAAAVQQPKQQQQQQRQTAAVAASASVAAAAAATSTQIESSSMSHMLMAANKNIAASVAN